MQKIEIRCLSCTPERFFDCILNKLDKIMRSLSYTLKEELKRLNYELADIYRTNCNEDIDCFLPIFISELKKFFKERGYELEIKIIQKCVEV